MPLEILLPSAMMKPILTISSMLRNLPRSASAVRPNHPLGGDRTNQTHLVSSPEVQDPTVPAFVQGSSKDNDLDGLAKWLHHSASIEENNSDGVWLANDDADVWNF